MSLKRWTSTFSNRHSVESKRFFAPSPEDLRNLIFDYLCHNAFTDTARAFVRESTVKDVDADGDDMMSAEALGHSDSLAESMDDKLTQAELRRDIRTHILSGRVDDAITLLNTHFPAVLAPDCSSDTMSGTLGDESTFQYIPSASIDSAHLHLNLHILGFIESARTVPLHYSHPGSKDVFTSPPPPIMSPTQEEGGSAPEHSEQQLVLLHKAQKLYSEAGCLPKSEDRALYLQELAQVTALLAYTDPENSIMAPYLTQDRREAVADQIEGAILSRTGQQPISRIELAARNTTTIWSILNERREPLPPRNKWPAGVHPPLSHLSHPSSEATTSTEDTGAVKKSLEQPDPEPFDLSVFLDSKSP